MPEHNHVIPEWASGLLKEQPVSKSDSRERIMSVVRTMPSPRVISAPMRGTRWIRRGMLSPAGSAAATLVILLAASLRIGGNYLLGTSFQQSAIIVGDTIVDRVVSVTGGGALHDTLRDTMRIVEFVVSGRGVESVQVAGDFDGWSTQSLQRVRDGQVWRGRLVVPRDALRFAYVVNNERRVPATPPRAATGTMPDSI